MTRLARVTLTILAALAASAPLPAQTRDPIVFPPNPSSRDAIRVVAWSPCPAVFPVVSREEGMVFIELVPHSLTGCSETSDRRAWVEVGTLPPGEWRILVHGPLGPGGSTRFDVRGVDPLEVYPAGAPASGGNPVWIADRWFGWVGRGEYLIDRVFFGETEGIVHRQPYLAENTVETPPHAPGIVDVTVVLRNGRTFVTPHAFKFYERGASPDPFVFEPLLFPSAYNGPGAEGSAWRTENTITPIRRPIIAHAAPCNECRNLIGVPNRVEGSSRPDGRLFWVARDAGENVAASSKVFDATRQPGRPATELPVVRLRDFRRGVVLLNIPLATTNRAMLRVWGLIETEAIGVSLGSTRTTIPLYRSPDGLPFGSLDLTPMIASLTDTRLTTLVVGDGGSPPVWAMVTVTDAETHQVSVLVPRP